LLGGSRSDTVTTMAALRRRLVAAVAVTSVGDGLVLAAFPLLALRATHSALLISGVAVASRLPWLLISLYSGALVDRSNRSQLVAAVDLARALLVAGIALWALSGTVPIAAIYVAAFLVGVGETAVSAAMRATVPEIAPGDELVATNGRVGAAQTAGTRFLGPATGGVIFSVSRAIPFFGDALSYVGSAALLSSAIPADARRAQRRETSVWADVRSGLRFFLANRGLRILSVVVSSFAFCQAMVLAVLVLFASSKLHLGATGYGVLLTVAGIGDVLAGLLARRVFRLIGSYAMIMVAGVAAAGGYVLLSSTSDRVVAAIALALEAAATSLGNVATLSTRQRLIPRERYGLVNNAFRMPITGLIPAGALVGGLLVTAIGFHYTFLTASGIQLAVLASMALPLRRVDPTLTPPAPAGPPTERSGVPSA
jgi:MFS family permease